MNQGREKGGGKKNKKARGAREDVDDSVSIMSEDEAFSTFQAEVASKNADGEEMTAEDRQDQLVEQLAEKRSSTRQAALTRLIDQLQQCTLPADFVSERLETLQLYLLNSIRKGDAAEVVLACRALSLVSVTLGPESESLVAAATPILRDVLRNSSKNSVGRASVAEAIAFIYFIGSPLPKDTLEAMQILIEPLQGTHTIAENIATACWEGWGLLASTLPTHMLTGATIDPYFNTLVRFLDDESTDVKTAAGENIALIMEAKTAAEADKAEAGDDDDEEESKSTPAAADDAKMSDVSGDGAKSKKRKSKAASSTSSSSSSASGAFDLPALISKLSALATDGNRHRGKKERASQRKSFRDILRSVEDGDVPEDSLKIEKSRHTFSGWSHIKQLGAVRDVLGKGLNVHFVHNQTISDIFDLYIESGEGVDDPARKAQSRAESKAKALENFHSREKQRKKKSALRDPLADE